MKKSLSEDSVDFYSHTWAFLFFLVLSLVCLFSSFSPAMTLQQSQAPFSSPDQGEIKKSLNMDYPRYMAACWTPVQFVASMNLYTNAVCASALNAIVKGQKSASGASIYHLLLSDPKPISTLDRTYELTRETLLQSFGMNIDNDTDTASETTDGSQDKNKEMKKTATFFQEEEHHVRSSLQGLISYKAPLYLFLFAICLKLPYVLWSLMSLCCGCMNVHQTLAMSQSTHGKDGTSQQIMEGKMFGKSTSLLYLVMKILMFIGLCLQMSIATQSLLEEADRLDNDLGKVMDLEADLQMYANARSKYSKGKVNDEMKLSFPTEAMFLCDFSIRQLSNLHEHTVQCAFQQIPSSETSHTQSGSGGATVKNESSTKFFKKIVLLYKALFTIVLATLVVLAICNLISLVGWLSKLLLASCRRDLGLKPEACLDVVFLVSMAWYNTSAAVAMDLAKNSSAWGDNSGNDQEEFDKLREETGHC